MNAGCVMRKSAARVTKILRTFSLLSVQGQSAVLCLYPLTCVCVCVKFISLCVYLAKMFREGMVRFVMLPQARRRHSPVRQVLPTGSVNINKKTSPPWCQLLRCGSAGSHANAWPDANSLRRAPAASLPACLQTGEQSVANSGFCSVCTP